MNFLTDGISDHINCIKFTYGWDTVSYLPRFMFAYSVFRTESLRETTLMLTSFSIFLVIDVNVEEEEYRVRPPYTMI